MGAEFATMVFVYGTLMPGHLRWPLIRRLVAKVEVATVPGRLYDTGQGYPAARFDDQGEIDGWVLALHPAHRERALTALDRIEGDQYRRVDVRTLEGTAALSYEWIGALADLRPLGRRWEGG
jgi:gamma-glutamylcyclotransferase (GGCT)/AIG2-like uncharacterized protein YtfP